MRTLEVTEIQSVAGANPLVAAGRWVATRLGAKAVGSGVEGVSSSSAFGVWMNANTAVRTCGEGNVGSVTANGFTCGPGG